MSEYSEIYCYMSCQNIPKYIVIYHVRIFPNILPYIKSEYSQIYCHISCQNIPKFIAKYHVRIFPNILSYIMVLFEKSQ